MNVNVAESITADRPIINCMCKFLNDMAEQVKRVQSRTKLAVIILTAIAVALIIASFFVPPMGKIDGSVLAATGEIFAFASLLTAVYAIEQGVGAKVEHKGTSLTIKENE